MDGLNPKPLECEEWGITLTLYEADTSFPASETAGDVGRKGGAVRDGQTSCKAKTLTVS